MKQIRFKHGVGAAVVLSVAGGASYHGLLMLLPVAMAFKLMIAMLGLGYIAWLLSRSDERVGRPTALALWLAAALLTWYLADSLTLYVLVHLGLLWLLRSVYFHTSVMAAALDLGLTGLALGAAQWAARGTGSVFMVLWCFFLVQALFPAIPACLKTRRRAPAIDGAQKFGRAQRSAEAALRRISANH